MKSFRKRFVVDLHDPRSLELAGEKLRIMSCSLKPWQLARVEVKCLTCGESNHFHDPFTAYDFCIRHRREGCKKVDVFVL